MKQVLIAFFSLVLGILAVLPVGVITSARAQSLPGDVLDTTSQAVAFVKADRSILYIKRAHSQVDAYDIPNIVNTIMTTTVFDSIRHLAVIGMAPDGTRIVLGGEVYYENGQSSVFEGIFRLPWPLNATNILNDLPFNGNGTARWFLKSAPDPGAFHPSGILSRDGSQWYAAMRTSSPFTNTMTFYHGHTDGSGTVDSAVITAQVAGTGGAPEGGWNMSNIGLDQTNGTMVVAEVDALTSMVNQGERCLLIHWDPSQSQPYATALNIKGLGGIEYGTDSLFALTVAPLQDGSNVKIGLKNINYKDNSIEFYTTRYDVATSPLNPSVPNGLIPRSILPDSTTFFAGENAGPYQDDNSIFHEHGQSGDVIVTPDGKTALFDTHNSLGTLSTTGESARNVKSAIYSYDFNESQAKLIYNDSTAQELQPVFVIGVDTIQHVPGITANANSVDFGTIDTGSTQTKTVTITDTSAFDGTILNSAAVTGDPEFTVVSPTFPYTIPHGQSVQLQLLFTPVLPVALKTATLTITSTMSADKSITVTLNGTPAVKPAKGVKEDASLAQSMSISPNPFSSIASVQLTAQDAGALGIVVHDALGRTVYTSPLLHVGIGGRETFNFDAKSLGLPNGIYYVTALFGDRQVSRQVVFAR